MASSARDWARKAVTCEGQARKHLETEGNLHGRCLKDRRLHLGFGWLCSWVSAVLVNTMLKLKRLQSSSVKRQFSPVLCNLERLEFANPTRVWSIGRANSYPTISSGPMISFSLCSPSSRSVG